MSLFRPGPAGGRGTELSFAERLVQLQVLRVILAITVALICLTDLGQRAATRPPLLIATVVYLLTVLCGEGLWARAGSRRHAVHGLLLGADGLYLCLALVLSGGMVSPLRYLLILDVVATSLLVSFRSGIRLTLWHCLLLQATYQLARTNPPHWWRYPTTPAASRELIEVSLALVAVALLTATAAAFNERSLRASRRDLEVLTDLSRGLEREREPHLVAQQLCEVLFDGYGYDRSLVAIVDGDRLRVVAARRARLVSHVAIDPLLRRALDADRPLLVRALDKEIPDGLASALPDGRDIVLMALRTDDGVLGIVAAERGASKRMGLEPRVLAALEQLVAHTALAWRRASLLVELGRLADTDLLTGLANRGAFDRSLAIELDRGARQGTPVGLLIADIDRFKSINDQQGHPAGDAVLRELGKLMKGDLRGFDLAARYGGEEFAVLLPGCAHEELRARAERLRLLVKGAAFAGPPITLSVGAASSPPTILDARALVAAADAALYEAKRTGRDRTVVDRSHGDPPRLVTAPRRRSGDHD